MLIRPGCERAGCGKIELTEGATFATIHLAARDQYRAIGESYGISLMNLNCPLAALLSALRRDGSVILTAPAAGWFSNVR